MYYQHPHHPNAKDGEGNEKQVKWRALAMLHKNISEK